MANMTDWGKEADAYRQQAAQEGSAPKNLDPKIRALFNSLDPRTALSEVNTQLWRGQGAITPHETGSGISLTLGKTWSFPVDYTYKDLQSERVYGHYTEQTAHGSGDAGGYLTSEDRHGWHDESRREITGIQDEGQGVGLSVGLDRHPGPGLSTASRLVLYARNSVWGNQLRKVFGAHFDESAFREFRKGPVAMGEFRESSDMDGSRSVSLTLIYTEGRETSINSEAMRKFIHQSMIGYVMGAKQIPDFAKLVRDAEQRRSEMKARIGRKL